MPGRFRPRGHDRSQRCGAPTATPSGPGRAGRPGRRARRRASGDDGRLDQGHREAAPAKRRGRCGAASSSAQGRQGDTALGVRSRPAGASRCSTPAGANGRGCRRGRRSTGRRPRSSGPRNRRRPRTGAAAGGSARAPAARFRAPPRGAVLPRPGLHVAPHAGSAGARGPVLQQHLEQPPFARGARGRAGSRFVVLVPGGGDARLRQLLGDLAAPRCRSSSTPNGRAPRATETPGVR